MSIRTKTWAALVGALLVLSAPAAWAQEDDSAGNAPQILTSDLARRQTLSEAKITADFVIVDTDRVVEVTIDGQKMTIQPATTVVIRREFTFSEPQTKIVVTAKDEAGNVRTLSYLVLKPGAEVAAEESAPKLRFFGRVGLRYEFDSNPSNDLSTPVAIQGVDVEGVVPDSDQPDTRTTLRATGGIVYDNYNALVGFSQTSYSKSDNEQFESTVIFLGGGLRTSKSGENGLVLNYLFTDINLGSFDYSQQHTLTPGYELAFKDSDGSGRHQFLLEIILKNFSRSDQDDATQFALKWDLVELDPEKQDTMHTLVALGNSNEGFKESEYTFITLDQDWNNKWDSGLLVEVGYGLGYRKYANDEPLTEDTPLGDTRVDAPVRFSIGAGFEFVKGWQVMVPYRYLFNLSNKQPYVRQIYGVRIDGAF